MPTSPSGASNYTGNAEDDQATPDFGQPAYELPGYGSTRPQRKGGVRWGWIVATLVVLLLILVVVAEILARIVVGQVAAKEIEGAMPEGIKAEVDASTTGWCVLCELAAGELSGLELDGKNIEFGAARGSIDLFAESITLTDPIAVGAAEGTVEIGEASLNKLIAASAEESGFKLQGIDLKDGVFGYSSRIDVFGTEVLVRIDASVRIQSGGRIQINAETLSLQSGSFGTDIPVDAERFSLEFCVAEHLPEMLEITSVEVVEDGLKVGYRSTEPFAVTEDAFQSRGSCTSA